MRLSRKPLSLAVSLALSPVWNNAAAQDSPSPVFPDTPLMTVVVVGSGLTNADPGSMTLDAADLRPMRAATSDTATLLRDVPGISVYGAGGVSSLPAIHGLADDRLRIKVDGMDLIAACPNHMNPALSYHRSRRGSTASRSTPASPRSASAATASAAPSSVESAEPAIRQGRGGNPDPGRGRRLLSQQRQCHGRQSFARRWPAKT